METLKIEFGELKDLEGFIDYTFKFFSKFVDQDIEKLDLNLNKENNIIS